MLDTVPDLRPTLNIAALDELANIFGVFDVTVAYDKPNRRPVATGRRPRPQRSEPPTLAHRALVVHQSR
jgi:hypothetical protein